MIRVEMTDTFGGETNYTWVTRVEDKTSRTLSGAIRKFKKDQGITVRHRITSDSSDFKRVDLARTNVCIMAWVEY